MIKKTGIFATDEERDVLEEMMGIANLAALMASKFGQSRADRFLLKAQEKTHKFALKHGLPEIEGYYGLDSEGQFIMET